MDNEFPDKASIFKELSLISKCTHNSCSISQPTSKVKIDDAENEQKKICYLIDSHVPNLRERAGMELERAASAEKMEKNQISLLKNIVTTKCDIESTFKELKNRVKELPKEWNLVHLTMQYNPKGVLTFDTNKYDTNCLYITVFNCGQDIFEPFIISLEPPKINGIKYNFLEEYSNCITEYCNLLCQVAFKVRNQKDKINYNARKGAVELKLQELVNILETKWLKEWKCLFLGKFCNSLIEKFIYAELREKVFQEKLGQYGISNTTQQLLYYITKGISFLNDKEIRSAVKYCLKNIPDQNLENDVIVLIKEINSKLKLKDKDIERNPIILIIDENLDQIPWEMIPILQEHPVSRLPSFHFAYFLYKSHENNIKNGHLIVHNYNNAEAIINPSGNLNSMETRMTSFYKYWLKNWKLKCREIPTTEKYIETLRNSDIVCYSGHGSGGHFVRMTSVQKISIKAVLLLFGCASVKLVRKGPQLEPSGSYHMLLMGKCPAVIGMLWTVSDINTDLFTTELLSNWIPSNATLPWSDINKSEWTPGTKSCEIFTAIKKPLNSKKNNNNLELLRALCYAKSTTEDFVSRCVCVARGLPVKILSKIN